MKLILCTIALCLVIGVSVFTTQKVVQAEARKTRNSMPGMLNNPLEGGQSLIARVDSLNASLAAINKRLTRIEEMTGREGKESGDQIRLVTVGIREEIDRLSLKVNTIANEQAVLKDIAGQLNLLSAEIRTVAGAIDAKGQTGALASDEVVKAMDWMVQKIEDIDSYFPPLYDFLGAVYTDEVAGLAEYPSVDLRLNEVILALDKIQEDAAATRKLVTPYVIEPTRYPKPFEEDNRGREKRLQPLPPDTNP